MAHTPGPWSAELARAASLVVVNSEAARIAEIPMWATTDPEIHAERFANARLIAAAPELLAALEALIKCADEQAEQLALEFGAGPEEAAITEARRIARVATGAA